METLNIVGTYIGGFKKRTIPQQLSAVVHIEDFTTPVNGYWVDKSGKNKQIQAATTTTLNDSLIMPANDADIISAVTMAGYYSKFYTTNSTPKTVLLSQIPSIDPKYSFFYDAKNKTKLTLFKTQGDEARADKMYEYTFKAYTGGYFPITQTSDSISFSIRGTGTHVFDWGDGTTTSYTLTTTADTTISKTWTTNLGGQKNISVTGNTKNWTRLVISNSTSNTTIRITYMSLLSFFLNNSPCRVIGSISYSPLVSITSMSCSTVYIIGTITGKQLTTLNIQNCVNLAIIGSITGMSIASINVVNCPLSIIEGNIETCVVSASSIVVQQAGVTYGGGLTKAWNISQTIQAGWNYEMLDSWFNAYRLTAPISLTGKTFNFAGTNQAPTDASLDARNDLINRGATIIINAYTSILNNNTILNSNTSIL